MVEQIKPNYQIQFSDNYTGGFLNENELIFIKKRSDNQVIFKHNFCNNLQCDYYGEILPETNLAAITYIAPFGKKYFLANRKNLKFNNEVVGIFYFDNQEIVTGKLFLNNNSVFKEAFTINYHKDFQHEVEEIMQTLQHVPV